MFPTCTILFLFLNLPLSFSFSTPVSSPMCPSHFILPPLCLLSLSTRPWDPLNDLIQFEKDGCIQTKVRHRTPMVRSGSLISLSNQGPRRDNCKCQVGRPNRNKTNSSPPQPPSTQHSVHRLHCRFFSVCRHRRCHLLLYFILTLCLCFFSPCTCWSLCMGGKVMLSAC